MNFHKTFRQFFLLGAAALFSAASGHSAQITYQWSTNLVDYHNDGAANGAGTTTVNFSQGPPVDGMVTVTAAITGSVIPNQLFVMVSVTQP